MAILPQTGLMGAEEALKAALGGSLSRIDDSVMKSLQVLNNAHGQAGNEISTPLQAAQGMYNPMISAGNSANDTLAALSGALGMDAQSTAFSNYMMSPGQQWLRDRGEQAVMRNAAATGGLGGGNVLKELTDYGIGSAAQFYGDDFNRMSSIADRGFNAMGAKSSLMSDEARLKSALTGDIANMGVNTIMTGGGSAADKILSTGGRVADGRTRAGELQADYISGTTSALSQLQDQAGSDLSTIIESGADKVAGTITGNAQQDATLLQNLAQLLTSIGMGSGNPSLSGIPGVQQSGGIMDDLARLAQGIGSVQNPGG